MPQQMSGATIVDGFPRAVEGTVWFLSAGPLTLSAIHTVLYQHCSRGNALLPHMQSVRDWREVIYVGTGTCHSLPYPLVSLEAKQGSFLGLYFLLFV